MNTDKCYTMTKYPNKFKNTYWGSARVFEEKEEIYINRNKFIEDYNIKNYLNNNIIYDKGEYDHIEFYSTNNDKNERIIIISTYGNIEANNWLYMENIGWKQYNCLYANNKTYILKTNIKTVNQMTKYKDI